MQSNKKVIRRISALVGLVALPIALLVAGAATASAGTSNGGGGGNRVTTSSLGNYPATFVGPAATGCYAAGCALLSGPNATPSTANLTGTSTGGGGTGTPVSDPDVPVALRAPVPAKNGPDPTPPTVSCQPLGPGCDRISMSSGGAIGVKGLNAVDSATQSTNTLGLDIEPADQGLCAGNGYVVEDNNIGEILIFNTKLHRESPVIPLDTVMGLTQLGWSSGGDISCTYDYANGGHWFFTEFVSASSEANEGPFGGCFAGVANACYEGIAVTKGNSPFGPYNVYYAHADYNPNEPGYPYLLNDFAKIATSRDAFLLFYDEFPLVTPGVGGGGFNGAQELAFNKNALERGEPTTLSNGKANPAFTVAIENMGLLPTPNGTCASTDNPFGVAGVTCWFSVIPAAPPDPSQYDNSHGGSAFMLDSLDFFGRGDNRMAVFDWTGLDNLNSWNCSSCAGIRFGGQLFSGVDFYYGEGVPAPQKEGPIPLGEECGAAGLSVPPSSGGTAPASCPEGGIATNGDNFTQVSQAGGQLFGAISTEIDQTYKSEATPELHQGAAYYVVGTNGFDKGSRFTLTSQGYVSPEHEDLEFPAMAAEGYRWQDGGNGGAIMDFTLSGDGGPTSADNGGFYPSTAFGRVSPYSGGGLLGSVVNIADLGQSPQDGFTEYQGYPGPTQPRWGDYSNAVFLPWSGGTIYFATNYIQFPNCTGSAFTLTLGTCNGTRDGYANWGTSVNAVVP
jgi:hypothetical protein